MYRSEYSIRELTTHPLRRTHPRTTQDAFSRLRVPKWHNYPPSQMTLTQGILTPPFSLGENITKFKKFIHCKH